MWLPVRGSVWQVQGEADWDNPRIGSMQIQIQDEGEDRWMHEKDGWVDIFSHVSHCDSEIMIITTNRLSRSAGNINHLLFLSFFLFFEGNIYSCHFQWVCSLEYYFSFLSCRAAIKDHFYSDSYFWNNILTFAWLNVRESGGKKVTFRLKLTDSAAKTWTREADPDF